jgi:hypothetical protein
MGQSVRPHQPSEMEAHRYGYWASFIRIPRWYKTCEAMVVRCWAVLLSLVLGMALIRPVYAQCMSNASSCVTCHETQGLRPVLQSVLPWRVDHGFFGDLCAACHGGNPAASGRKAT